MLEGSGVARLWHFLLGGPGETIATLEETLDFAEEHIGPRDLVLLTRGIRLHPGTPLWRRACEEGLIAPDHDPLEPAVYLSPDLDREAFMDLVNRRSRAHPNWIERGDGFDGPAGALAAQALAFLGCPPPFWPKIPVYKAVANLLGIRRHLRRRPRARTAAEVGAK